MISEIKINNVIYNKYDIYKIIDSEIDEYPEFLKKVFEFLGEWFNNNDYVSLRTSGSTGKPKVINLSKRCMIESARSTITYFDLKKGDRLLLAMSAEFIAGKMMILRALLRRLDLYVYNPVSDITPYLDKEYDFCALVPYQVISTLRNMNSDFVTFNRIKKLIIGGGVVDSELELLLDNVDTDCYSTYGMTETASHVAIRNINKTHSSYFIALPGIEFLKDERDCLVIKGEHLPFGEIITNDVVELFDNKKFEWKGRYDNVINSGGVKLHPEEIEKKIEHLFSDRFFISKTDDSLLGEIVVLVIESEPNSKYDEKLILDKISILVKKYECPKKIIFKKTFEQTSTNKIRRIF